MAIDESDKAKLIEYLYRVAIEPEQFDHLMQQWGKVLDEAVGSDNEVSAATSVQAQLDEELVRHITQATGVLEKIGQSTQTHLSLETPILMDPNPAMIIDRVGNILLLNKAAGNEFDIGRGDPVSKLPVDSERIDNIYSHLNNDNAGQQTGIIGLAQAVSSTSSRRIILVLSHVSTPLTPEARILVTTLVPMWNDEIKSMLGEFFDLTLAESQVVQGLVYGSSLSDIAQERGRALSTVRNQLKKVLRKTGAGSQVDLINLVGGLKTFTPQDEPTFSTGGGLDAEFFSFKLPDGRHMEYFIAGDRKGRPVVFIHGMLDGYQLTPRIKQAAVANGLRLIAPARPGYGGSSLDDAEGAAEEKFADDIAALLDHLAAECCPIIGHMGGSVYAFAFAGMYPKRVSHIINISGTIPFATQEQIDQMSPNHARMATTLRRFPKMFPMFLRAGVAVLERKGETAFLKVLYGNSPIDYEVACIDANTQVLNEGFRVSAIHDHKAFMIDMQLITSDWSRHLKQVICPVLLFHGHHDKVIPMTMARQFASDMTDAKIMEFPDAGQLVLYQCPEEVLELVSDIIQNSGHGFHPAQDKTNFS